MSKYYEQLKRLGVPVEGARCLDNTIQENQKTFGNDVIIDKFDEKDLQMHIDGYSVDLQPDGMFIYSPPSKSEDIKKQNEKFSNFDKNLNDTIYKCRNKLFKGVGPSS